MRQMACGLDDGRRLSGPQTPVALQTIAFFEFGVAVVSAS
jgi:hypothetical protein